MVAGGKVSGQTLDPNRSQEFLAILDLVCEGIEPGDPVHVISDNVSSHESVEVSDWPRDHLDWTFLFTPASATWMNAVEGYFSRLLRQRLKHAIFNSLDECIAAIAGYIGHHKVNDARPFSWSKQPEALVEARKKGHRK